MQQKNFRETRRRLSRRDRGIVLIVSLIMLAVISLFAAFSVRGAVSSEAVNGNVRLSQLAGQSADIALHYCEDALPLILDGSTAYPTLIVQDQSTPPSWQKMTATWDASSAIAGAIPLTEVNRTGAANYLRPPECVIERLIPAGSPNYSRSFVITARGFGPEVPAVASGATRRPEGSEAFLQSTIEF